MIERKRRRDAPPLDMTLADLAHAYRLLGTIRPSSPFPSERRSGFTRGIRARIVQLQDREKRPLRQGRPIGRTSPTPAIPDWMVYIHRIEPTNQRLISFHSLM